MEDLLLHICCAPCAIMPIKKLKNDFNITGLFFNPNIHPYKEYLNRLDSVRKLSSDFDFEVLYLEYDYINFLKTLFTNSTDEPKRCEYCYDVRLQKLDEIAKERGIKNVSTSLLYSIYQKHELIIESANKVIINSKFVYEDFRPFYRDGVNESIKSGYYRQSYCGCIFSNYDRYKK